MCHVMWAANDKACVTVKSHCLWERNAEFLKYLNKYLVIFFLKASKPKNTKTFFFEMLSFRLQQQQQQQQQQQKDFWRFKSNKQLEVKVSK